MNVSFKSPGMANQMLRFSAKKEAPKGKNDDGKTASDKAPEAAKTAGKMVSAGVSAALGAVVGAAAVLAAELLIKQKKD